MSIKPVYIAPCVYYRVIIKEWGCFARQIRRAKPAVLVRSAKFGVRRERQKREGQEDTKGAENRNKRIYDLRLAIDE